MASNVSFQEIILKLQQFWAREGCILWQPYHTEVGAGTMNPATFMRVLGPEPWNVAYVEPSIRPADGRYGENPNRWQHYYQFQVILKPDPGDPQGMYLRSLVALGIDPRKHDIRFVEDNWEQPALGAWGLGWEVWLDGQEITQFTYFQQAGGVVLDPVAVEITYGLERIVMSLQKVDTFLDIQWNDQRTYGDLLLQPEIETCRYNFDHAGVERLRVLYDEFEAEANAALEQGLIQPAYDYILKCSHAFNLLDARGAVGVAERAALFARTRDLARRVAEGYIDQRARAGYPWGDATSDRGSSAQAEGDLGALPERVAPFVLEIGVEELPAKDLAAALDQLDRSMRDLLADLRLDFQALEVLGTPRRLVVRVEDLAAYQREDVSLVKGPPAERAFDLQGNPTKAALGFAAGKGLEVDDLAVQEMDGGRYVVAQVKQPGEKAAVVLQRQLPGVLKQLRFDKSMRWDNSGIAFSRPIRWLLALHGARVVPFEYAALRADRITRGLRFSEPEQESLADPDAYFDWLEAQSIQLDPASRREKILSQVQALAAEVGGIIPEDAALLEEVSNLVEAPAAFRGAFDERFLSLPRQVLISVMRTHQRYFPVERDGTLLPFFIAVANTAETDLEAVQYGNEQVIRARFADAAYFFQRDLEQPLDAYLPRLKTLTFQTDLGSMFDKVKRLETLAASLSSVLGLSSEDRSTVARAATLCKADLATEMVVEMTSLQGEMGREYALRAGEPEPVAEAIFEHYLPRYAGDALPRTRPGLLLSIADRLDSLTGLFAAGLQPTGTRDPYGLRRAAMGLLHALTGSKMRIDLRQALDLAAQGLPMDAPPDLIEECLDFIAARHRSFLLSDGWKHDVVDAVLAEQRHDPTAVELAVSSLTDWTSREDWPILLQAYARCARITRSLEEQYSVDPQAFVEPAAISLLTALELMESTPKAPGSVEDFFSLFEQMVPAITAFFDQVLVMDEDPALRKNRLGLLQRIVALSEGVVDLTQMDGF